MATDSKRKISLKRKRSDLKLLKIYEGQKVEVRNFESGLLGSWHSGTVISCKNSMFRVRHDHLLCENSSGKLVEDVRISPTIDGAKPADWDPDNYRGEIRPLPPSCKVQRSSLCYGECVDVLSRNAWWEGVVFDHEDGSGSRRVFFPDLGDEMIVRVNKMRITQDWNEDTDEWKVRGNWIFLELIEEAVRKFPLLASVKQIWYGVSEKNGDHDNKEWTFFDRDYWREMVALVLHDHLKLTISQFSSFLNSEEEFIREGESLAFSELAVDDILKPKDFFDNSLAIQPFEETTSPMDFAPADIGDVGNNNKDIDASVIQRIDEAEFLTSPTPSSLPHAIDGPSKNSKATGRKLKRSYNRSKLKWISFADEAEFCPESIVEFKRMTRLNQKPPSDLYVKLRKHLLWLGWKVESAFDKANGFIRFRYFSPSGTILCSLAQVCKKLESVSETLAMVPLCDQRSADGSTSCSSAVKPETCRELSKPPSPLAVIDPVDCDQAVMGYVSLFSQVKLSKKRGRSVAMLVDKARTQLLSSGWKSFSNKRNGKSGRNDICYLSPGGKVFYSLIAACKWHVKDNAHSPINSYLTEQRQNKQVEKLPTGVSTSGVSLSDDHVQPGYSGRLRSNKSSKKRKLSSNASGALIRLGDVTDSHSSTRVRRSSKRVTQLAPSSNQRPRSIIFWLIENNGVLPRTRVQYRGSEDGKIKKEGRIIRDGIKCYCCQEVYGLSSFGAHAGSTYLFSSANIFLEDGRSIYDCLLETEQRVTAKSLEHPRKRGRQMSSKSDYICSICHDGGELILCDRCPSAFHVGCIGMKELPDGDWYCPYCSCEICGQSITDNNAHSCCQCGHQYHVACIRNKGLLKNEEYWFCNEKCEQIFLGLQKLLGKPIQLGTDNLTWTLLKYTKPNGSRHGSPDDVLAIENFSKLNVAIGVMHECFEPIKESLTGSDVVEDIIFSRRSELNRLNFQGFYTVVLERNDEQITVATLRVLGEKLAEIPLVATRFQYRRLGMCHKLIDFLEKKLAEVGVERLVLPAATSALETWIHSFGFSVMEESEKLNLLNFTTLNFHGTIMCQKLLARTPSLELIVPAESNLHSVGTILKGNAELDRSSDDSEVLQAEQIDGSDIIDQRQVDTPGGIDVDNHPGPLVVLLKPATVPNPPVQISSDHSTEAPEQKVIENRTVGPLICYRRRRLRNQHVEANL